MAELKRETELFGTDIPRLEGLREKGRAAFRLPTPKTEAWKYTRLHVLKNGDFVPPASKFLAELSGEDGDGCGCSGWACCSGAADCILFSSSFITTFTLVVFGRASAAGPSVSHRNNRETPAPQKC